jgi:hypothetical protein
MREFMLYLLLIFSGLSAVVVLRDLLMKKKAVSNKIALGIIFCFYCFLFIGVLLWVW